MKKYNVEIKGTTPLLINRFREKQIEGKTKTRLASPNIKDDIKDKLYEIKGKYYVPARYIEACLISAGKGMKVRGKGKSTYSKIFGSALSVEPEALVLINQKFDEFRISAVNPNTKGRMMVSRPMFTDWGLKFEVISELDELTIEVIEDALVKAGKFVGIGDWRPDKKGKYGKFIVVSLKEVKA